MILCIGEIRSSGKSRLALAVAAPSGQAGLIPGLLYSCASPAWFLLAPEFAVLAACPYRSLLC